MACGGSDVQLTILVISCRQKIGNIWNSICFSVFTVYELQPRAQVTFYLRRSQVIQSLRSMTALVGNKTPNILTYLHPMSIP
jgi:hypothetical protein